MSKLRPRPQAFSNPRRRKSARHRSYLIDDFVRWQTRVAELEARVDELEAQLFKYGTPPTSAYARRMEKGAARRQAEAPRCSWPKPVDPRQKAKRGRAEAPHTWPNFKSQPVETRPASKP